jgi:hypothetical protein
MNDLSVVWRGGDYVEALGRTKAVSDAWWSVAIRTLNRDSEGRRV